MNKTLYSVRHKQLAEFQIERRKMAGLTQVEVARRLGRHQPFIANIESGEWLVDVVELLELADAIGFDPRQVLEELLRTGD